MANFTDLVSKIKRPNGNKFAQELRELQEKAQIAETLIKGNAFGDVSLRSTDPKPFAKQLQELRWKAQVLDTLSNENDHSDISHKIPDPKIKDLAIRLQDIRGKAQLFDVLSDKSYSGGLINDHDQAPGRFSRQLQELQGKIKTVEILTNENVHLRMDLQLALRERNSEIPAIQAQAQSVKDGISRQIMAKLGEDMVDNGREGSSRPDNVDIQRRLKDALSARKELIARLRRTRENRTKWVEYSNSLAKRLEKREATLAENSLLNGLPFQCKESSMGRPTTVEPDMRTNGLVDDDQHGDTSEVAPCGLDLEGDITIGTPDIATPKTTNLTQGHAERRKSPRARPGLMQSTFDGADFPDNAGLTMMLPEIRNPTTSPEESPQLPRHAPSQSDSVKSIAGIQPELTPEQHASSTQGDPDLPAEPEQHQEVPLFDHHKDDTLSDSPVVVSTRVVRKRKAKTSPQRVKIKNETRSSSPVAFVSCHEPHESLDLDEIGQKTITPKKRRRIAIKNASNNGHNGDGDTDANDYHYQHPPSFHAAAAESMVSKQPITPQISGPRVGRRISALEPKSPNKQILPRTTAKYSSAKRRRGGIDLLSEDNENGSNARTPVQNQMRREAKPNVTRRLASLLDVPSPRSSRWETGGDIVGANFTHTMGYIPHGDRYVTPKRGQGSLVVSTNQPHESGAELIDASKSELGLRPTDGHKKSSKKLPHAVAERPIEPLEQFLESRTDIPRNEPFRCRPVWRLGLEHFKVNADHNQGYDYAFKDVVRGREQRKCLPGCTKPECCGNAFRKFAELTSGHTEDQTSSQAKDDERLLEDYLGGNVNKLRDMSKEERQETLIQAKARELANKHGKHRHAFERRQSPPGFWRADFPTTQEAQSDRAEAAKFERELVNKRFDEAMREGGKWKFRDE